MMSFADFDAVQETLALLSDPDHAREVAEADEEIAAGRTLSLGEVRRRGTRIHPQTDARDGSPA